MQSVRRESAEHDGAQQSGGVVVVLCAVLDKAPAIHIAHVTLALLTPQQVKATDLQSMALDESDSLPRQSLSQKQPIPLTF